MLWMFGQDVSFYEFVCFDWLLSKNFPTPNILLELLVNSQSLYEKENLIGVLAFHDDWGQSELVASMSPFGVWEWQVIGLQRIICCWTPALQGVTWSDLQENSRKKYLVSRKAQGHLPLPLTLLPNWAETAAKQRERTEQRPQLHLAKSIH